MNVDEARKQPRLELSDGVEEDRAVTPITIRELDRLSMDARKFEWAASTYRSRISLTKKSLHPQIRDILVDTLEFSDAIRWLDRLKIAQGSRNIALAHLSDMMRHGEILGLRSPGSNPCNGMRKRKSGFKAKYLSKVEFFRLGNVLRRAEAEDDLAP